MPSEDDVFKEGDIVNVDCSTIVDGYFSDSSRMFCSGEVSEERKRLVEVTREAMLKGLEQVKPWGRLGDVGAAVKEIKAGKVEYRLDKTAIIHCPIGKKSFTAQQLEENLSALMGAIVRAKPAAAKGIYLRSVVMSSTMGPGVKLNTLKF